VQGSEFEPNVFLWLLCLGWFDDSYVSVIFSSFSMVCLGACYVVCLLWLPVLCALLVLLFYACVRSAL